MKIILGPTHMRVYEHGVLSPSVRIPATHLTANSLYVKIIATFLGFVCYALEVPEPKRK